MSRIIQKYLAYPQQVLQTKPYLGTSKRLTDEQLGQVKSWASHNPVAFGFEGQYWTRARFQVLIRDKFGVNYQVRQVGNMLKHLKITWQKPKLKDYRQKPEQVEAWRQESLPTIKKKLSRKKA